MFAGSLKVQVDERPPTRHSEEMDAATQNGQISFVTWLTRYWRASALAVAICIVLSLFAAPWLASRNQDEIGVWGFILSVWGIPLALIGFAVTLWQLARTQNAANAANAAIERVKKELRSFDIVLEVRTTRSVVADVRLKLVTPNWEDLINSYNKIRESLTKIDHGYTGYSKERKDEIKDFRAVVLGSCTSIENARQTNFEEISLSSLSSQLIEIDDFLISLEFELKESIGGE
jgi:hypothetical protein